MWNEIVSLLTLFKLFNQPKELEIWLSVNLKWKFDLINVLNINLFTVYTNVKYEFMGVFEFI